MYKKMIAVISVLVLVAGCNSGKYGSSVSRALERDFVDNIGDRIHFGYDSSSLSADARSTLKRQAIWLKTHPEARATVQGHCDVRGTREYNLGLGERRANAARQYLESQGVSSDRLETTSYGKERPADLGTDSAAHSKNRRSVTVLQ